MSEPARVEDVQRFRDWLRARGIRPNEINEIVGPPGLSWHGREGIAERFRQHVGGLPRKKVNR